MYLGSWKIGDVLTFSLNTYRYDTGVASDADSNPSYRIYEDENEVPILTGTLSLLDSVSTTGFYTEAITLSAEDEENEFEKGKSYNIYIQAIVNSVTHTFLHTFQIEAEVNRTLIADAIWDELLTGATHNTSTSAGRRLRELSAFVLREGTAQAGTINSITFDDGASSVDNIYNRNRVAISEGTGAGQTRIIIQYAGDTLVAITDRPWVVAPDDTSLFHILAGSSETNCIHHGVAQDGTANSITLEASASAIDDYYKEIEVRISGGTGAGQQRFIPAYTGESKVAAVSPNWKTIPDNTSIYHLVYSSRIVADSFSTTAIQSINVLAGSGAVTEVVTVTDGTNPIDGVGIWITNDEAGTDIVAGTIYTNANGQATFHLNTGSYYSWKELAGYNFDNPESFIVST